MTAKRRRKREKEEKTLRAVSSQTCLSNVSVISSSSRHAQAHTLFSSLDTYFDSYYRRFPPVPRILALLLLSLFMCLVFCAVGARYLHINHAIRNVAFQHYKDYLISLFSAPSSGCVRHSLTNRFIPSRFVSQHFSMNELWQLRNINYRQRQNVFTFKSCTVKVSDKITCCHLLTAI